jgi:hypothetical protein
MDQTGSERSRSGPWPSATLHGNKELLFHHYSRTQMATLVAGYFQFRLNTASSGSIFFMAAKRCQKSETTTGDPI